MHIAPELLQPLAEVRLASAPVAIAFLAAPPPGLERIERPDPASCGYWRQASEGRAFYTTADDHGNCPVGAFTHGVALSPAQGQDLQTLVGTMVELKYLRSDEVPMIPHRTESLKVAAYAPLSEATFNPDLVVFRGNVRQIMLLSEAARAAGVLEAAAVMGRPACAMLPHTLATSGAVASVGCIGNRVYTGLGDDELYLTLPGGSVATVLENLATTLNANAELEAFHRQRAAQLT